MPPRRIVLAAQFFFGGWFLFHGLNFWFHFFEQSNAPIKITPVMMSAKLLIPVLTVSGLFTMIKVLEVIVGLFLLANRYVPLLIAVAAPITVVIAYLNLVIKADLKGLIVGVTILALHAIMALGYWEQFKPMLVGRVGEAMPRSRHALFILLGIAVPIALTFVSML
jgi:uncharacterized membrane protein